MPATSPTWHVSEIPDGPPDAAGLTPAPAPGARGDPRLRRAAGLSARRCARSARRSASPAPRASPTSSPRSSARASCAATPTGRAPSRSGCRRVPGRRHRRGRRPPDARPTCRCVGRIAAGGPILAEQVVDDVFPLPRQIVGDGELFLLQVKGDSMIEAAITDGDWVVVRRQQHRRARRHRRGVARRRGDGQDLLPQGRPRLAAAAQPGLLPDRRRPRDHPRPRHGGTPQGLDPV